MWRAARRVCALQPRLSAGGQRHCVEVKEASGSYTLTGITRNGQPLKDDDTVTVTCLAAEKQMEALLASESGTSLDGDTWVKNTWRDYVSGGGAALAEPENYITLR